MKMTDLKDHHWKIWAWKISVTTMKTAKLPQIILTSKSNHFWMKLIQSEITKKLLWKWCCQYGEESQKVEYYSKLLVLKFIKLKSVPLRGKSLLELWVTTFLPDWQLLLIFVRFILNFLCICSNSVDSAHVILK